LKFKFVVEVDTKNDGITRDAGHHDLASIIMEELAGAIAPWPWVIMTEVGEISEGS